MRISIRCVMLVTLSIIGCFFETSGVFAQNVIQLENAKVGSPDWQLTNPATNHEVEGYASLTSVNRGGQISFFINTIDSNVTVDVFRMGWYGGGGARRMMSPVTVAGTKQIIPTPDATTGIVECRWTNPYILNIPYTSTDPTSWASGVYLARLTGNTSGKQSFIIFVVRDDNRPSPYLFQLSVNTFQAYNNWGGKSLYNWNSTLPTPAINVSFNRPYALGNQSNSASGVGAGEFLTSVQPSSEGNPAGSAYNMLRFLEREGYDLTYITDIDAHENGTLLLTHQALLVVGHSEYWSWEMRTNIQAARDGGIGIGFFSSNTCYWQIRFVPSAITGAADRTIVAYKGTAAADPYASNPSTAYLTTTEWRLPPVNLPEDALVGVMYGTDKVNSDIIVSNASHWAYTNTGLQNGAHLTGILGYEIDYMQGHQPSSTAGLAHEVTSNGTPADTVSYTASRGNTVFATGSFQWSWGLDDYNAPNIRPSVINPSAQQITRNVLARLAGQTLQPAFSIIMSPRVQTVDVVAGITANYSIQLADFGYSPTLALSVAGLPPSTAYSFSASKLTGSGSSVLTISPTKFAPLGTYVVTVSASDGIQTRTEAVVLVLSSFVPKNNWQLVYADSQEIQCENGTATRSFDGDPLTIWHTQYCPTAAPLPHEIQIDMGAGYLIQGFRYLPRQDGGLNGRIGQYEFYGTNNLSNWGSPLATGAFANDATEKQVLFAQNTYRYIRLRALTEANGKTFTSMAELTVVQPSGGTPALSSIVVTPNSPTIFVGANQQFTATGSYQDGSSNDVSSSVNWSSSTSAATISATGLATAQTPGTSTITAALSGLSGSTSMNVQATSQTGLTSISKTGWSLVYVDSQESQCENGAATRSFDNSSLTLWHTQYCPTAAPLPHEIQIDMGAGYLIQGFRYLPRQDGGVNGRIGQYEFYATNNLSNWGSPLAAGTFANDATEKQVLFAPNTYRYIRLRALTEANGHSYTSMAELTLLQGTVPSISKTGWSLVYVDSQESQCENGAATRSFDNSSLTLWHTQYCPTAAPLPHEIQIDMGAGYLIQGFRYLPRQDGGVNGRIGQYEFYATNNLSNWGSPLAAGTFANDATEKQVLFAPNTYRYIRLRALTEANGHSYTSMAELTIVQP